MVERVQGCRDMQGVQGVVTFMVLGWGGQYTLGTSRQRTLNDTMCWLESTIPGKYAGHLLSYL